MKRNCHEAVVRDGQVEAYRKEDVYNNNKRQHLRRRNMSVDITRAPYKQSGNVVRDSSAETRL